MKRLSLLLLIILGFMIPEAQACCHFKLFRRHHRQQACAPMPQACAPSQVIVLVPAPACPVPLPTPQNPPVVPVMPPVPHK
jgi:hypothetical protein